MPEMLHGQIVDGHLGGYVPGGDPNTTYPLLWDWFVNTLGVRTILDIGCGDGRGALESFRRLGASAVGVDGIAQPGALGIIQHDYTTGTRPFYPMEPGTDYDLVWSAEFVEHVEERYVRNFLADFALGLTVAFTHAVPGQGGYHHVNCQTTDYWRGAMAAIGYRFDAEATRTARTLAVDCPGGYSYFQATGMIFRRHR